MGCPEKCNWDDASTGRWFRPAPTAGRSCRSHWSSTGLLLRWAGPVCPACQTDACRRLTMRLRGAGRWASRKKRAVDNDRDHHVGFPLGTHGCAGPTIESLGTISLVTLIISDIKPISAQQSLVAGLLALGGGLLQTVLALLFWPVRREYLAL